MKVILLDDALGIGKLGTETIVKPGYARNFLIPSGKAILATKKNQQYLNKYLIQVHAKNKQDISIASAKMKRLQKLPPIVIGVKSGEDGKIFGSVGAQSIAQAITKLGVKLDKKEIRLLKGAFKKTGEYKIKIQIHEEVFSNFTVIIKKSAIKKEQ